MQEFIFALSGLCLSALLMLPKMPNGFYMEIDGSITGVLASLHDLTELKQTELQLQLQLTNEELSRATRLKDEFLANMTHELRTPLNAILGRAETLQEQVFGDINDKQRKALQTIERRIWQVLINLLNNAMKFTSEGGKIILEVSKKEELIESSESSSTQCWLPFAVIDTGIGIAPKNIDKLSEKWV